MNKKAAPFIKVVTTKGTLLINRSTSEETLALYDEMKKTIKFEENTEINCQAVDKRRLLSAIVIVAVVAISLGISLLPLLLNNGTGSFSIKDNGLVLDGAHGYGRTIPINDVLSVQLVDSLPHISRRTNGYAVGNVNFGHYKLKDGRKCMLYLNDASQKPFIQIETADNLYFINCTTSDETAVLYRKLMENN